MARYQLVLSTLGLQLLKPVIYKPQFGQPARAEAASDYPEQQAALYGDLAGTDLESTRRSWLGTPVFSDVAFARGPGQGDFLIDTVLIDVSQRRNIVTTAVQGRNGTVKEYVSDGDYEVRLRGAIVSQTATLYPAQDVRALQELLTRQVPLDVVSEYLRLFNIYSLVVMSYNFPQVEGFQNMQPFEITLLSDAPEELVEENATPDQ